MQAIESRVIYRRRLGEERRHHVDFSENKSADSERFDYVEAAHRAEKYVSGKVMSRAEHLRVGKRAFEAF